MIQRLFFWLAYALGNAPWDSGITPPEIVALVEEEYLLVGRALDVGCGTGTTSIFLASHGWQVVGIDFMPQPIKAAKRKAKSAGVAERVTFITGNILDLRQTYSGERFDLAVDIGCGHSLPESARRDYVLTLADAVKPDGSLMLYMFRPTPERERGLPPERVEAMFAPFFQLTWNNLGHDAVSDSGSAWYRFKRTRHSDIDGKFAPS